MRKEKGAEATTGMERKLRKRLGEWDHQEREHAMPGVGTIRYKVVVVTYQGHTWERPDTPEGRAEVTRAIQAVNDRARRREQVVRLRAKVAQLIGSGPAAHPDERQCLSQAADLLTNVAALMEANDQAAQ